MCFEPHPRRSESDFGGRFINKFVNSLFINQKLKTVYNPLRNDKQDPMQVLICGMQRGSACGATDLLFASWKGRDEYPPVSCVLKG